MVRLRAWCSVAVLALAAGSFRPVAGQASRITVQDSATGLPVAGAVVTLIRPDGSLRGRLLTDAKGQFAVSLDSGSAIRVQRIGFKPRDVTLTAGTPTVWLHAVPSLLDPILSNARSNCPRRADAAATVALYEQVRSGLLATLLARAMRPALVQTALFDRTIVPTGEPRRVQRVRVDSFPGLFRPFGARRSGAEFVRDGFLSDSGGDPVLVGPDADVLIDPDFAGGYCFRIVSDSQRTGLIGLGFAPHDRKDGRVDVDGVLWLDSTSRSLQRLTYEYRGIEQSGAYPEVVDVPGSVVRRFRPGGEATFTSLGNGITIITQWVVRTPQVVTDTTALANGAHRNLRRLFGGESGGAVLSFLWPDGTSWNAPTTSVRVTVSDRAGLPAAGRRVELSDAPYEGVTDSKGVAVVRGIIPGYFGVYAGDDSARLAGLLPSADTFVEASMDSTVAVEITARPLEEDALGRCDARAGRSPIAIIGRVPDASAVKSVSVARSDGHRVGAAYVNQRGGFLVCAPGNLMGTDLVAEAHDTSGAVVWRSRARASRVTIVRADSTH